MSVLELLHDNPGGLTLREVAEEVDASQREIQNTLRRLYLNGEVKIEKPRKLNENQLWRIAEAQP